MKLISILVSTALIAAGVPAWADPPPQVQTLPTAMQVYCAPGANPSSCVAFAAWHWFRKVRVVFDPSLEAIQFSSGVWAMTIVAKWLGGDAPAIQYMLLISRAGVQAGAIGLLLGTAAVVIGTIVSAGSFLFAMVTPAGGPGDEMPTDCAKLTAPYNTPDGLQKLLQLPEDQYQQVIRCLPTNNALGELVNNSARNAAVLEQSTR